MHRNAILFQLVYSSLVTDQSVYCCISNCSWNYKPSGNFEHDFSLSVISYEKTWPHIAASNYLYLFVWASFYILFILFFKQSFCNGPETELKCNTGFRGNIYNWHFIIYGQLVLSPFSTNVSWGRTESPSLFWLREWGQCRVSLKKRHVTFCSGIHSKNIPIRISPPHIYRP